MIANRYSLAASDSGEPRVATHDALQLVRAATASRLPHWLWLPDAIAAVADALQLPLAKVLLLSPDGEHLTVVAGVGWESGVVNSVRVPVRTSTQAGLTMHVMSPVVCRNLAREHQLTDAVLLRRHGVVSGISTVIHGASGPIGVLSAHDRRVRDFTSAEIAFLVRAAALLGRGFPARNEVG